MVYLDNTLSLQDTQPSLPEALTRALDLVQHHSLGEHPVAIEGNLMVLRFFKCRLGSQLVQQDDGSTRAATSATLPTGHAIPYSALQTLAMTEGGLLKLERLCHSMHAVNHFIARQATGPLRLTLNPRLANQGLSSHDARFMKLMEKLGIDVGRLIVYLPEPVEPVISELLHSHYQRIGITLVESA